MNRFFPNQCALIVLILCLLSTLSIQAQTYSGQSTLVGNPTHLEAVIYPVDNFPATIKVIFNNRTGGAVRVVIKNEQGKVFYDEFETVALYRRRFDLSDLPHGTYTVELSKKEEHFTQAFSIESPPRTNIALLDAPVQRIPDQSGQTKLVVKQ